LSPASDDAEADLVMPRVLQIPPWSGRGGPGSRAVDDRRGAAGAGFGRRALRLAGLVLVQVAVFGLLVEVVARWLDPLGISYYPETAAYFDTMVIEEPIGYRNRPGLEGTFWGVPVAINALGLRDEEISGRRPADEARILFLGDSLVFGLGLEAEHTIPRQLEDQLQHRADGTVRYRVVNMGTVSYNSEQEYIQYQSLGASLGPQLVLLFFTANDLQPKMWVFERRRSLIASVAQRSYAASLLAILYWELRLRLTGHDNRFPYRIEMASHPGWATVEASLGRIAALCRQRGIPFVLLARERYPRLEALAGRLGFPFLAVNPVVDDPRWRDRDISTYLVSRVNGHPNRRGAEADATVIRERLESLGLLPRARAVAGDAR
jgi:lysophospholipase L1-like esterase